MTGRSPRAPTAGRMPTWFLPHGAGPCFFMDWNPPETWHGMRNFLTGLAQTLPRRPRAIVVVSAHWLESSFQVTAAPRPALVYDYYGFPPHTYALRYPAAGDPGLARHIASLLQAGGVPAREDRDRGYDHGMFVPLKLIFPDADIPVVQLSLRADLDPGAHLEAGRLLTPLRDEDVLIIGSGMSFHNMRGYGDAGFTPASEAFDTWLTNTLQAAPATRDQALREWTRAPDAYRCHPRGHEEHLVPLMVAAGAAGEDTGHRRYSEIVLETRLSAFRFG